MTTLLVDASILIDGQMKTTNQNPFWMFHVWNLDQWKFQQEMYNYGCSNDTYDGLMDMLNPPQPEKNKKNYQSCYKIY